MNELVAAAAVLLSLLHSSTVSFDPTSEAESVYSSVSLPDGLRALVRTGPCLPNTHQQFVYTNDVDHL